MEEIHIPDFMKAYYEGADVEGQVQLEYLAQRYERERQKFMQNEFIAKSAFQADWNRVSGIKSEVDPDEATSHIRNAYREEARETAIKYGYVDSEPQENSEQDEKQEATHQNQSQAGQSDTTNNQENQSIGQKFSQNSNDISEAPREKTEKPPTDGQEQLELNLQQPQTDRGKFMENLKSIRENHTIKPRMHR